MTLKERFAKYFEGKSVLVMGMGTEGRSSLDFLLKHYPDCSISVYDKNPVRLGENLRFISGDICHIRDKFDIILKSPGIPLPDEFLLRYKNVISSQTDIFLREFHKNTVGITGTKGKSTTVSLLNAILFGCGRHSILAGNIGIPVFDILPEIAENTIIVLELSSHQLQFIKKAPHISVILNVYPEHLDFYKNFVEYRSAKLNIVKMQDEDDQIIFPIKEFSGLERRSVSVPFEIIIDGDDAIVYYWKNSIVLSRSSIELRGSHNLYNIGAALIAAQLSGCETEDSIQTVYSFKGLEHRLEFFGNFGGVDFYNDSISTIPQAAAAAIRSFDNKIGSLILGGHFRGEEIVWTTLSDELKKSEVANIFFLPETGLMIYNDLLSAGFKETDLGESRILEWEGRKIKCFFCDDLMRMIPMIKEFTPSGTVCLLSPASSSYNMFKNFEERGRVFKELVNKYYCGEKND
jgi:UDP-N-acetylmuramoyl-L-alanine---L-glutamate ligase